MLSRPATRYVARHIASRSGIQSDNTRQSELRVGSSSKSSRPSEEVPLKTIFIRSWDTIGSLANAFAVIRAVERRYGSLKEYRVWRDSERPQIIQTHIVAAFRSPESFWRVPEEGEVLQIPAPQVDPDRDGGISLDDLQGLLAPQDFVKERELPGWSSVMTRILQAEKEEGSSRMIDVKVERARHNWQNSGIIHSESPTRMRLRATGHAFLQWGGFYDGHVKPTDTTSTSQSSELASHLPATTSQSEHGRMREALVKWKRFLGQLDTDPETTAMMTRDPQSTKSADDVTLDTTTLENDTPEEWDPLPEVPHAIDTSGGAQTFNFIAVDEEISDAQLAWWSTPNENRLPDKGTQHDSRSDTTTPDKGRGGKVD